MYNPHSWYLVGLPPAAISLIFKAFYGFGQKLDKGNHPVFDFGVGERIDQWRWTHIAHGVAVCVSEYVGVGRIGILH